MWAARDLRKLLILLMRSAAEKAGDRFFTVMNARALQAVRDESVQHRTRDASAGLVIRQR
jgi:hypothetical protein